MVSKRKVLLIITGLFLFGAIGRFAREDKPKSKIKAKEASAKSTKPTSNKENNVVAWEIAKAFVEDRLKSPSTAEFPWSMQGPDVNVHMTEMGHIEYWDMWIHIMISAQ